MENLNSGSLFIHEFRPSTVIKVTGEDAFSFLQGQFTNELRQATGTEAYGLWLNQKGKVVADSHVLTLDSNQFQLVSETSPAAVVMERLARYIVADDVSLADETPATLGLVLGGAGCGGIIEKHFGVIPARGEFLRRGEVMVFPGSRLPGLHFDLTGPEGELRALEQPLLANGGRVARHDELERARILARIPAVPVDLGPADLPNEGGLEGAAISYTKGCYLGQEVMARLKNLGQVRRRLHFLEGAGALPVLPAPVYQGSRRVGEIRSASADPKGFVALAMLSLGGLDLSAGLSLAPGGPPTIWIRGHE